jgi:expansin (peptidoglycan-binding protein)
MNRLPIWARRAACITTFAVLAACNDGGGGGSDSSASSAASGNTSTTPGGNGGGTANTTPGTSTPPAQQQPLGAVRSGEGTFYAATGAGQCSFDPTPNDLMVAAMSTADHAGAAVCGAFAEVTGPKGSVTVRIVDRCPECKPGDVDLSAEAFARIAEPVAGRVPITWKFVAGDVQGPVSYRYKEGSTRFWTAIQVRNHRLPITRLEILPAGSGTWIELARADYNYFIYPTPIAGGPLQVRVNALGGATIQNMLPEPQGGLVVAGTAQFF